MEISIEEFLEAVPPDCRSAWEQVEGLQQALADFLSRGTDAWPGVELDNAAFLRHVAARCPPPVAPARPFACANAAGLYLACACLVGSPAAVQAFEETYMPIARSYLADYDLSDTERELCEEEFGRACYGQTSDEAADPAQRARAKLSEYKGKASLKTFVHKTASNFVIDYCRKRRAVVPLSPDYGTDWDSVGSGLWDALLRRSWNSTERTLASAVDAERYAASFRLAFETTVAELEPRARACLLLVFKENRKLAQLEIPTSTAHDLIKRSLQQLFDGVTTRLARTCHLTREEVQSLVKDLITEIELSLSRILKQ